MATEHEIDRLLVRMVGDGSSYQNMMKEAEQTTDKVTSEVKKGAEQIEQTGRNLESFAKSVAGAVTTYLGAAQLQDFFQAFTVQEQAEIRLRAVLESNERQVESLFEDYASWASALQEVSTQGDELSLQLLQQAESLGLTGDAAKRAVQNSLALATAMGGNSQSFLRVTAALEEGETAMLTRYLPALRQIENESERAAKAQELLAKMFAVVEAETSAKAVTQLSNSWGDFKEQLGAVVAEGLVPVVASLKKVVMWLQSLSPEVKRNIIIIGSLAIGVTALSAAYGLTKLALVPLIALLKTQIVVTATLTGTTRAATVATLALRAALFIGLVVAFVELAKEVTGANESLKEFNAELERTKELDREIREVQQQRFETFVEDANAIKGLVLRGREFRQELERMQRESESLKDNLEAAQEALKEADTGARHIPVIGFGHQAEFESLTQVVESAQFAFDAATKSIERIKIEIAEIGDELPRDLAVFDEFDALIAELELSAKGFGQSLNDAVLNAIQRQKDLGRALTIEEIERLARAFGLAGIEAEAFSLSVRNPLAVMFEGRKQIIALTEQIEQRKEVIGIMESLTDSVKDLGTEAKVLEDIVLFESSFDREITDAEKSIIKLRTQIMSIPGIDAATIDSFEKLADRAEDAAEEVRQINEVHKLLGRSFDVIEAIKTPEERHRDAVAELDEMFKRNMLTLEQYNKALAMAQEQLDSQTQSVKELRRELERLEGTLAGTAEAQFRIAQHREALNLPRVNPLPIQPPQMPQGPILPGAGINQPLANIAGNWQAHGAAINQANQAITQFAQTIQLVIPQLGSFPQILNVLGGIVTGVANTQQQNNAQIQAQVQQFSGAVNPVVNQFSGLTKPLQTVQGLFNALGSNQQLQQPQPQQMAPVQPQQGRMTGPVDINAPDATATVNQIREFLAGAVMANTSPTQEEIDFYRRETERNAKEFKEWEESLGIFNNKVSPILEDFLGVFPDPSGQQGSATPIGKPNEAIMVLKEMLALMKKENQGNKINVMGANL